MAAPGVPFQHFPVEGFVSLVAVAGGHPGVAVGMMGRGGVRGAHVVLGVAKAPVLAVVQGQGWARRLTTRVFQRRLAAGPSTKRILDRHVSLAMSQFLTAAACDCHGIDRQRYLDLPG